MKTFRNQNYFSTGGDKANAILSVKIPHKQFINVITIITVTNWYNSSLVVMVTIKALALKKSIKISWNDKYFLHFSEVDWTTFKKSL